MCPNHENFNKLFQRVFISHGGISSLNFIGFVLMTNNQADKSKFVYRHRNSRCKKLKLAKILTGFKGKQ